MSTTRMAVFEAGTFFFLTGGVPAFAPRGCKSSSRTSFVSAAEGPAASNSRQTLEEREADVVAAMLQPSWDMVEILFPRHGRDSLLPTQIVSFTHAQPLGLASVGKNLPRR